MKVERLIELLQKLPPNTTVAATNDGLFFDADIYLIHREYKSIAWIAAGAGARDRLMNPESWSYPRTEIV